MATDNKSIVRMDYLLTGIMILLLYFMVNANQYAFAFFIYLALGFTTIFFNYFWGRISKAGDLEGLGKHWIRNFFIGIGLGIATIIAGQFISIIGVIGIPQISASVVGAIAQFFIIVIVAPIFESAFFLDFVLDFLNSKLQINKWVSLLIMSAFASLFHYYAYGQSLQSAGGSFFSAFIMFFLFGAWSEYQNDLSGAISWHMALNYYIKYFKLAVGFG